jgi:hypothetical protein
VQSAEYAEPSKVTVQLMRVDVNSFPDTVPEKLRPPSEMVMLQLLCVIAMPLPELHVVLVA